MSGPGDNTAARLGLGLGAATGGGTGWTAPAPETLAEAIPGLRVFELAGRGGMGAVYRAEQTRLGRIVAVKVLAPAAGGSPTDPLAEERFEREARVLAGLAHPHVLQIYDAGRLPDGTRYLVTEWAEGGDLAALAGRRPQPAAKVAEWVRQVAAALDAAHARGIVHRDLKPANVLVRADGRLALADFGLARAEGAGFTTTLTLSGVAYGTADYMAPEQMRGEVAEISPATDVYALGVMTHELLTGRVPRGVFAPASRATGLPVAVDAAIAAAMADEPSRRLRSAGEFSRAFERALGGGRTRKAAWAAAALGAAAVAAGATVLWPRATKDAAPQPVVAPAQTVSTPAVAAPAAIVAPTPVAIAAAEPVAPPRAEPAPAPVVVAEPAANVKRSLLDGFNLGAAPKRGGWSLSGGALVSDGAVCWIGLPERVPSNYRYEVVVEFTRRSGRHSVGVFLPTSAGTGVFELDAWEAGVGGLQMIDGEDIRANGSSFPAALRNGERQQVHLIVDGATVSVTWNGAHRRTTDLRGRNFDITWLWEARGRTGLGLCSWQSPTVFHRVDYRAL